MPYFLTPPDPSCPTSSPSVVINTRYFLLSTFQSIDKSGLRPAKTMALSSAPSDVGWIATALVVGMVQEELLGDMRECRNSREGWNKKKRKKKKTKRSSPSIWLKQNHLNNVAAHLQRICLSCRDPLPSLRAPADPWSKEQERSREITPAS